MITTGVHGDRHRAHTCERLEYTSEGDLVCMIYFHTCENVEGGYCIIWRDSAPDSLEVYTEEAIAYGRR